MSAPSDRPDLNAFMDAYGVLGVEYTATPLDIRTAFKRQARLHHPDRFPPGTREQQQATERMAALNGAYQLVRDAPLRHHRVSTGARPDEPWTDAELIAALRRSRSEAALPRRVAVAMSALGVGLYVFKTFVPPVDVLPTAGAWRVAEPFIWFGLFWAMYLLAAQTRSGLYLWSIIDLYRCGRSVLRHFR